MTTPAAILYKHANSIVKAKVGLEVHAKLNIKSKLFSRGSNSTEGRVNSQLDFLDVALPGSLPKLNKQAFNLALLSSLGLNCKIQNVTHFDRKNYFYADMPAGYQITQYNKPIARDGFIEFIVRAHHKSLIAHSQHYDIVRYVYSEDRKKIDWFDHYIKRSIIKQVQLEQDSAKTLIYNNKNKSDSEPSQLVDYSRSGSALIEIVFEPDIENHFEATSLVKELILILKTLNTCDCHLQEGSLRVDANVSILNLGDLEVNSPRVELKNLNSLKALSYGIDYEVNRQAELIANGHTVLQETRTYDSKQGKSILLRLKPTAIDYRYVPEPSLPPIEISNEIVNETRKLIPCKMPSDCRQDLMELGLELGLVEEVITEPGLSDYLVEIMHLRKNQYDINLLADFLIYTMANLKNLKQSVIEIDLLNKDSRFMNRLNPSRLVKLLDMAFDERISFSNTYEVIKIFLMTNDQSELEGMVKTLGLCQINDRELITKHCEQLISHMKNIPKRYSKRGQNNDLRYMLDKMSCLTNNRINVRLAIEVLNNLLRKQPNK